MQSALLMGIGATVMNSRPTKHSLTLKGHRTSVSLEHDFWRAFQSFAKKDNRAINDLAAEIDANRGADCGLASAIRLYVLGRLKAELESAK